MEGGRTLEQGEVGEKHGRRLAGEVMERLGRGARMMHLESGARPGKAGNQDGGEGGI